ncbi:MAG TPA: hypothetical protein VIR34_06800 [Gemmatimonadaceae bacterium]
MIRVSALTILLVAFAACGPSGSSGGDARGSAMPSITDVLKRHTDSLMSIPGVVGVGRGEKGGAPTIYVMVERMTDSLRRALPDSIEGYAVDVNVTGEIKAQPK